MTDTQDVSEPLAVGEYRGDYVLGSLVDVANRLSEDSIQVTLHVSGLVVTGTLMSNVRFFEELSENKFGTGEYFALWADRFREAAQRDESDEDWDLNRIEFIHLKNATVFTTDGKHFPRGLWRGRIEEVSGWSLGSYTADDEVVA